MKAAKVFKSGNSHAVRLPKEFQLDVKEVGIFRQDGDLILRPIKKTWQDYFCRGIKFTADYPDQIDDMPAEERGGPGPFRRSRHDRQSLLSGMARQRKGSGRLFWRMF